MRKKRILSLLCILLCLTFLPFGVFAQGTEKAVETQVTTDESNNMTEEELSDAVIDLKEEYGITTADGIDVIVKTEGGSKKIYFKENEKETEMNDWINDKSKEQLIKSWNNQSNVDIKKILKVAEVVYKGIQKLIPKENPTNYGKLVYEELIKQRGTLDDIKSELNQLSAQLSAGVKSILKQMDRNKMEERFDEASYAMKSIEKDYFTNSKEVSQANLDLVTSIEKGDYADENTRIYIDNMLHNMYSNGITTSLYTKASYEKGFETNYFTSLSNTGDCLTGDKYQSSQVSAFELFEGINGYFNAFNSSTFEARQNENEQIKGFFEKNYVICMLAMAYDESTHTALINAKLAAHDIVKKAVDAQKISDSDLAFVKQNQNVIADQCVSHNRHIGEDKGRQNTLNKQFVRLVDETGTPGSAKSQYNTSKEKLNKEIEDAKVYNGHPGKLYCYLDDHWYTRTVMVANGIYPQNQPFEDYGRDSISNFLESKYSENKRWLTYLPQLRPGLIKSDLENHAQGLVKNLVGEKGIQESMTIFKNFNRSFLQEIKKNFYYSSTSDLNNAKVLKDAKFSGNYPYFYINGWQGAWTFDVPGCDKTGGKAKVFRYIRYIDGSSNDVSGKQMDVAHKEWAPVKVDEWDAGWRKIKMTYSEVDKKTNFMWLKYASTNGNEKLLWSENADYGLDIVDTLTNVTSITIDDGYTIDQDQYMIHSLNEDNALNDVTIKISALQPLAVGTHTLTIANDTSSVIYELEIVASDEGQLLNEGDYVVDKDSLQETLQKYEEKYPDAVVSLYLDVDHYEEDISEDDAKLIQEKAGNKICVFADFTLNVFVDGELKETASADQIENPIKVSIFYPLNQTKNEQVLRVHNGELSELTSEKNADGESVIFDKENNLIIGEASKFSTYALVYEKSSPFAPATGLIKDNPALFVIIGAVLVTMIVSAGLFIYKKRNGHTV